MTDTIFALATPPGKSAIAVFRLSGPAVADLATKMSGKTLHHRQAQPCLIYDETGAPLDEVMLLYLGAPASPTGQNMLEIYCHGSLSVVSAISSYLARQPDIRVAEAGEFTKRAFDHGKMDLTEVEGLADLIDAQTNSQRRQALGQLKGVIRKKATAWRQDIITLSARLESLIDFSDEELPDHVAEDITTFTKQLIAKLSQALSDEGRGEMIRNGVTVSLLGPVNAGKSTALNALAKREAAIVSDEAGTTRDIVEVRLDLEGMAVILQDTAGIRQTSGTVESIGIARAKQAATNADIVLLVLDATAPDWQDTAAELRAPLSVPTLTILNKCDLTGDQDMGDHDKSADVMAVSLHNPSDVARLETALAAMVAPAMQVSEDVIITRTRHRSLVEKARDALQSSQEMSLEEAPELAAEELRRAADALGHLTGHIDVEDILSDIFSSFCIGK